MCNKHIENIYPLYLTMEPLLSFIIIFQIPLIFRILNPRTNIWSEGKYNQPITL